MNSLSLIEEESAVFKVNRLRGWLSRATPLIFGVRYVECLPILAGQASGRTDIVGRDIILSEPPPDAVFYNVAPDPLIESRVPNYKFDYVLGNSDATKSDDRRLPDGTLVYWSEMKEDDWIAVDDPLIVRLNETHRDSAGNELIPKEIAPDWFCLRRAGTADGVLFSEDGRLFVRSKKSDTNEVILDQIDLSAVQGRVFSQLDRPLDNPRVSVAAHLPFAPSL